MALKTILACLMSREQADAVLACAVPLAREHGAHLVGLHTLEALLIYPGIAIHVPDEAFSVFNANQKADAEEIRRVFEKHAAHEDFPSEWRLLRAESASAGDRMIECARAADLVIMPREGSAATRGDQNHVQARVIRESGRPVVIAPPGAPDKPIGRNIVLGWSDTREATRAAHDLLLLARPGTEIAVVRVDGGAQDEMSDFEAFDLAEMYDRHGLQATVTHLDRGRPHTAETLLKHAFEVGADLVVTGAFGHSRAYDFVIGAVTHKLMLDAEIPVLFSR